MRKLLLTTAVLFLAIFGRTAVGQLTNGNFTADPTNNMSIYNSYSITGWTDAGFPDGWQGTVVGTNYGLTNPRAGFLVSSTAASMSTLRAGLAQTVGPNSFAPWAATTINGSSNPSLGPGGGAWPTPLGAGTSSAGSAFFQDFTIASPSFLTFNYNFITSEVVSGGTPPAGRNDFAFVSLQKNDGSAPTIYRLADTNSPLPTNASLLSAPFTSGSNGQTGLLTASIPGIAAGTYRVAFGVVDVGSVGNASGLAVSQVQLGGAPAVSVTTTPASGGIPNVAQALNFGNVRVTTTSGTQSVNVNNLGSLNPPTTLIGTIGAPVGAAGFNAVGGSSSFTITYPSGGPVPTPVSRNFAFTPAARGLASAVVHVLSNDAVAPDVSVALSATGVGPVYNSTPVAPGGTISFGTANVIGDMFTTTLTIDNTSNDGVALAGLTLISASITGGGGQFTITSPVISGQVLAADGSGGGTLTLNLKFTSAGPINGALQGATLSILTDQGAALGANGQTFNYTLQARNGAQTLLPEPGSLALWSGMSLVGLIAAAFRRRKAA